MTVVGDPGKARQNIVQHLAGALHRFEILTALVTQTEIQAFSGR